MPKVSQMKELARLSVLLPLASEDLASEPLV